MYDKYIQKANDLWDEFTTGRKSMKEDKSPIRGGNGGPKGPAKSGRRNVEKLNTERLLGRFSFSSN